MVSKSEDKVPQLKGKDAEDAILKYLKKVGRSLSLAFLVCAHRFWFRRALCRLIGHTARVRIHFFSRYSCLLLEVLTRINPMAVADISANLKNAVSKAATQKILLALSEKQSITQKTYGTSQARYLSSSILPHEARRSVSFIQSYV